MISFDTQVILWGVLDGGDEEDAEKRERSRILFDDLSENNPNAAYVLSSVAVAELLTRKEPATREQLAEYLAKNFIVAPFEIHSANLSAKLYDQHSSLIQSGVPYDKRKVRLDTMIVASAKVAGATVIYSHDERLRTIAESVLIAKDLPTHSEQLFAGHNHQP